MKRPCIVRCSLSPHRARPDVLCPMTFFRHIFVASWEGEEESGEGDSDSDGGARGSVLKRELLPPSFKSVQRDES